MTARALEWFCGGEKAFHMRLHKADEKERDKTTIYGGQDGTIANLAVYLHKVTKMPLLTLSLGKEFTPPIWQSLFAIYGVWKRGVAVIISLTAEFIIIAARPVEYKTGER
ncbi:hypothetical protein SK128_010394, partial [Halocaridina rubra]